MYFSHLLLQNNNNIVKAFCPLLFLLIPLHCIAQADSMVVVSKNFKFRDGLYFSVEEFKNNAPRYSWDQLDARLFSNPQTFLAQVAEIKLKETEEPKILDLQALWGFCLGGLPYIRLEQAHSDNELTAFAGLRVRGRICYVAYEQTQKRQVPMPVYNPLTGHPFRMAHVEREERVLVEKMMDFESGEQADFTLNNFISWIQDDPKLLKSIEELDETEARRKLFKCLLIYDDRHIVKVPY